MIEHSDDWHLAVYIIEQLDKQMAALVDTLFDADKDMTMFFDAMDDILDARLELMKTRESE